MLMFSKLSQKYKLSSSINIDSRVKELLDWDKIYNAIEFVMKVVTTPELFATTKVVMGLPSTENFMLTFPGYISDEVHGALSCKLLRAFPDNPKRPIPLSGNLATIILLKEETGELKAVVEGTEITEWRTAAATAVATKYAHKNKPKNILAIIGAGAQGRIHAIGLYHYFKFNEVRIWNRTPERARKLADELNQMHNVCGVFVAYETIEGALNGTDVIVTATTGDQTLVKLKWIKPGAHINALAVHPTNRELEDAVYIASNVYVDNMKDAKESLKGILELGVEFAGQIGDLITNAVPPPDFDTISVFQSLGMAIQDGATARLIYDLHSEKQ